MLIISHRGNLNGPNPDRENSPSYIEEAIKNGLQCEVDLRVIEKKYYLGHDTHQYEVDEQWIRDMQNYLWIHCKNHTALSTLITRFKNNNIEYFFHTNDEYTLTTSNYIWMYPSITEQYDSNTIMAVPERVGFRNRSELPGILGVCTDYPQNWI